MYTDDIEAGKIFRKHCSSNVVTVRLVDTDSVIS